MNRLYIIGRADLPAGLRSAQAGHAAFSFALEHPKAMRKWGNEYLILVEAPDKLRLHWFASKAKRLGIPVAEWREPDLNNELTAIALGPTPLTQQLCSGLPLMHSMPQPRKRRWRSLRLVKASLWLLGQVAQLIRAAVSKTEDAGLSPVQAPTSPQEVM